uniref:Uncharacterized protein n=1 Tax=Lates calcarifer TaxID=8187 RepID=A0A4W6D852_LATCA
WPLTPPVAHREISACSVLCFKFCSLYLSVCVYSPSDLLFVSLSLLQLLHPSLYVYHVSIEVHPPAHPSTCQQTAAQSVDATSFDMVKQYCTSSLFLFAHL